ncbi:MAG: Wzz/FepE/Etk N-terminal domain-containing protein [Caldicoprobacterales bacterium]
MSEISNDVKAYEDEIDLRELFAAIWKNRYIILSLALIAALLAGLYSMFLVTPVYHTKLEIVINMPDELYTRFGNYTLPITSNDQYIGLITSNTVLLNTIADMGYDEGTSIESIGSRISINSTANSGKNNIFGVTVSASSPQESLKLAETLFDNYVEFIDVMTKQKAVEYFYNYYSTELLSLENTLKSNQELLKKNEELLAMTSKTIHQKEAMQEIEENLLDSIDYIVLENVINQNYVEIEKKIIELQQAIYSIEDAIRLNNEYLTQLDEEKELIDRYYETGSEDESIQPSLIGVTETSIYLPSKPVAPNRKSSPSNSRNAVIGLAAGLMLGLITAYVKEFWITDKK